MAAFVTEHTNISLRTMGCKRIIGMVQYRHYGYGTQRINGANRQKFMVPSIHIIHIPKQPIGALTK